MHSTQSTLNKITDSFPNIEFQTDDIFRWSPEEKTIYFVKDDPHVTSYILHEISHAQLNHENYNRDIELLRLERDAWDYALNHLAGQFNLSIDDELVQDSLDTYRDWLHSRSTCPNCSSTGVQDTRNSYKCLACNQKWRVNDGRGCELRRYKIK